MVRGRCDEVLRRVSVRSLTFTLPPSRDCEVSWHGHSWDLDIGSARVV